VLNHFTSTRSALSFFYGSSKVETSLNYYLTYPTFGMGSYMIIVLFLHECPNI
jgi:hypothetical protein